MSVSFEGTTMFETQTSPTWEVLEDYGGEGCGSCIAGVSEVFMLP